MSTKADFYIRQGTHTEWIGSLERDCDPETLKKLSSGEAVFQSRDVDSYRGSVTRLLNKWEDDQRGFSHFPEDGWPWLWPDSTTSDWGYVLHSDHVDAIAGSDWLSTNPC